MKLVLCSEGFYTPNTVQACVELCGKPQEEITVGIINEAFAVEEGDKHWVVDNLNSVVQNFTAEVDIIDLLALSIEQIEARLSSKDVIFVVGGNSDYQMRVFEKSGLAKILPRLLETKVYVGSSAGSMVLGRRISSEAYSEIFGERDDFEVKEFMSLVDLAIVPHMNSALLPNNRKETIDKVAKNKTFPVYGLQDDGAIIIDGDKQTSIGSDPYLVDGTGSSIAR